MNVWRVRTDPSVSLIHEGTSASVAGSGGGGQDSGFFRALPDKGSNSPPQLFAQSVGTWGGGNANVVPGVANGKVFVATNQQLTILGLK